MFLLELEIELAATILSGNEFHNFIKNTIIKKILITLRKTDNLADLNRFSRVKGYSERVKQNMKTLDQPGHVVFCLLNFVVVLLNIFP